MEVVTQYIDFLKNQNIYLPYLIYITLTGVKSYRMASNSIISNDYYNKIDRDILTPSCVVYEDFSMDISNVFKPIFDSIWNACGYEESYNYDDKGNFKDR